MWFIRKLLAYIKLRREADMICPDGRIERVTIVNESHHQICIKVFYRMGFTFGRFVRAWVDKTEETITNIRWPAHYAPMVSYGLVIIVLPMLMFFTSVGIEKFQHRHDPRIGQIESSSQVVLLDIIEQDRLPDGHYSVTKLADNEAIVVQHKAGPYRDFAYWLKYPAVWQLPDNLKNGDRFTVFQGRVV